MDFRALRARSAIRLERLGLDEDMEPLPLLSGDDLAWVRPAEHAVARCHAIAAALAVEQGAGAGEILDELREHDLERWLAGPERDLVLHRAGERELGDAAVEQAEIDVSWRQEALWALLWALGFVEELRADEPCGDETAYERMAPEMDPAQTVEGIELRPVEELAAELDFHFCWHWQLRRAEQDEDVVRERRLALEWLVGDEDWEQITLDT
jgi:hypothetical protein